MIHNPSLVNNMIKKRCAETAKCKTKTSDNFKHVAALTTKRGRVLKISGNKFHTTIKHGYTIHAEVNTIQHAIRPIINKYGRSVYKRRIPVDITVIRTSLVNSHPCMHCVKTMVNNPIFAIKRIYYSTDGDISYCSMSSLLNNDNPHVSKGNRETCCSDEETDEDDKEAL